MLSEVECVYEYKPKLSIILWGGGLFGFGAAFLAHEALTNDRGLIINHMIELSEGGATIFYWVLCIVGLCAVALDIALIFHLVKFHQRIALTATDIVVPISRWSAAEQAISYQNIICVSVSQMRSYRLLHLTHSGGKFNILESMLPSDQAFDEICALLTERVREVEAIEAP